MVIFFILLVLTVLTIASAASFVLLWYVGVAIGKFSESFLKKQDVIADENLKNLESLAKIVENLSKQILNRLPNRVYIEEEPYDDSNDPRLS